MCGIVGCVGSEEAIPILLDGLSRLEYRGYDSAGIAVLRRGRLKVTKVAGRIAELRTVVESTGREVIGIGHTRWATHGEPNQLNAHPHVDASGRIAIVHNGIIENADQLRAKLESEGTHLVSETDSEVLAHLIAAALAGGAPSLEQAVRTGLAVVSGTYGLLVLDTRRPGELVAARNGSPVLLGVGDGEMFVASDVAAIVRHTQQIVHLEDGEIATIRADAYRTITLDDQPVHRSATSVDVAVEAYELDGFDNFMAKEIHEQPAALQRTLLGRLDARFATAHFGGLELSPRELREIRRVKFLGCGSAQIAGQMGANLIEELARIPADAESAAEFRNRNPVVEQDTLYVAVSQSGETLDTLLAVQELNRKGARVIGAVNVVGSAIAREAGSGIFLHAGPEVAVASTKAFTNMVACFAMLGLVLGRVRDLSSETGSRIVAGLHSLPAAIAAALAEEDAISEVAMRYAAAHHMFFVGRGTGFPVAREGAQKLKELSYVHAEAYQASELKHGPLALVDSAMPSVVVVKRDDLVSKNIATIEQIRARGGPVIAISSASLPEGIADKIIQVPTVGPELDPIVLTIATQLFAYATARALGRDIDKPRNLAKSVTVE